jgi:hypothetical protein
MVGVSRETTNKQLAMWRTSGIVETAPRAIIIRNSDALQTDWLRLIMGGWPPWSARVA